jgi:hypothetical protein
LEKDGMIPPRELKRAVSEYDASLKVMWGPRSCMWMIGKPLPPGLMGVEPKPRTSPRGLDLNDLWRAGMFHVMNVHPSLATNGPLVKEELARCDAWAQGGMKRLADALEAQDEKDEAANQRHIANTAEALTSDFYDHYQWLEGNRVAVTDPPREAPGEARDGYIVRDRRLRFADAG